MLTSAQMRYHRLKPVSVFFSEESFRNGFYKLIQPDAKQKETIDQLLSKYARINSDIQNELRKKMDSAFKEYWKELEPNLTKVQIARLKDMEKRMNRMSRGNGRNDRNAPNYRDNGRMQQPSDGRPQYNRDSNRMRDYGNSDRMMDYRDSNRMREYRNSDRVRGGYRDSSRLQNNKEQVIK